MQEEGWVRHCDQQHQHARRGWLQASRACWSRDGPTCHHNIQRETSSDEKRPGRCVRLSGEGGSDVWGNNFANGLDIWGGRLKHVGEIILQMALSTDREFIFSWVSSDVLIFEKVNLSQSHCHYITRQKGITARKEF